MMTRIVRNQPWSRFIQARRGQAPTLCSSSAYAATTCACAALLWLSGNVHADTDLKELAKSPPGQKIAYGSDALQFGELHMPEGTGPHPVVINIHGGCWLAEYNIDHSRALANALAKEGMAVWNIEYRRVGDEGGGWPGTFLDVAQGADHLRTLAKEHPLDLSRVVVMGHSAGGHLALWLAARHKILRSELYKENPIRVVGVIGLAPAPELKELQMKGACGNVVEKLMGGTFAAMPERYEWAMPSALAPIGARQVLIIGKRDKDWEWVGKAYAEKARALGDKQIEVIDAPEAGHFEVIDPQSSAWVLVLNTTRDLLRKDPISRGCDAKAVKVRWERYNQSSLTFRITNDLDYPVLFVAGARHPFQIRMGLKDVPLSERPSLLQDGISEIGRDYHSGSCNWPTWEVTELTPGTEFSIFREYRYMSPNFIWQFGLVSSRHTRAYERVKTLIQTPRQYDDALLLDIKAAEVGIREGEQSGCEQFLP